MDTCRQSHHLDPSSAHFANRITIPLSEIGREIHKAASISGLSSKTTYLYLCWARRFVVFHRRRHPVELGQSELEAFIRHLSISKKASASTQNQALHALCFLYKHVLRRPWRPTVSRLLRAKKARKIPELVDLDTIRHFLGQLVGVPRLVALLQFGSGLRLKEIVLLKIKDLAIDDHHIMVRGDRERTVPLPCCAISLLQEHIRTRRIQSVAIINGNPIALGDQLLFVGNRLKSDHGIMVHPPLEPRSILRAYQATGLHITSKTLRQRFGIMLLEGGANVRMVQQILGQKDIHSTLRYQKASNLALHGLQSPIDTLIASTPRAGRLGIPPDAQLAWNYIQFHRWQAHRLLKKDSLGLPAFEPAI
jgi:site-specific recombinase XerD